MSTRKLDEMVGSFIRRRYPLVALAAILTAALALLLIEGGYGTGLLQLGIPAWEQGTTGAGSGVADLSHAVGNGETDVPGAAEAGSGYQTIDSSQTTGGQTTSGNTAAGPAGGQTTGHPTVGGQVQQIGTGMVDDKTTGSQTDSGQTPGGQTTADQPTGGLPARGQSNGDPTVGGQISDDQQIGSGMTGGQIREGTATPELPSSLLVVLGLIPLLAVWWLNARRRNVLDRR